MTREEIEKEIRKLPKIESSCITNSYNSVNVDDLLNAVDRLKKVPTYDELLKENKQLKENINLLDKSNDELQEKLILLNRMNEENYEKYCYELKKNKKAVEYIKNKIKKSFNYECGLENSSYKDRLFTETVIELQLIQQTLESSDSNE